MFKNYFQYIKNRLPPQKLSGDLIKRFHTKDINTVLANPCIVDDITQTEQILQQKEMRLAINTAEKYICQQCPLKKTCPFNEKLMQDFQPLNTSQLHDHFLRITEKELPFQNFTYWKSAIRLLDTYQSLMEDQLHNEGKINKTYEHACENNKEQYVEDLNVNDQTQRDFIKTYKPQSDQPR